MPRLIAFRPSAAEAGASAPAFLFAFLLAFTFLLYWPGLSGPFVFDDFAPTNLPALGAYGEIHDWETLKLYLTRAHAGPTGRPIAMLSFLLNATDWPADPFPFKLTNLILHLLNGCLLYAVLVQLLRRRYSPESSRWIALIAAGWWLIHPMWVSTVLYVVQRMAMLPVTFTLLTWLVYLHGRSQLPSRRGYSWMTIAVVLGTLLATFSKENGVLLPLLLLVGELVWMGSTDATHPAWRWQTIFLVLPTTVILGYLAWQIPNATAHYAERPFTLAERLLTETRALCEYLRHLFFPRLRGSGLFHDGFPISRGLLEPATTAIATGALFLLILAAWWYHRRFPLFALAVGFYLGGHLIESTVIPLELYYEHRNYLPTLFLFLPVASILVWLSRHHPAYWLLPAALSLMLGFITYQRVQTWKDEYRLLTTWAMENPTSVRAQIYGALTLQNHDQHQAALALLLRGIKHNPLSLSLQLYALNYECALGLNPRPRLTQIRHIIRSQPFDFHDYDMFETALRNIHQKRCYNIPPAIVHVLLNELETNSAFQRHPSARRKIAHWRGEFLLAEGKARAALAAFHQSQSFLPDIDAGLLQVAMLASKHHYSLALTHLALLEHLYAEGKGIRPGMNYIAEMQRIHNQLLDDLRSSRR